MKKIILILAIFFLFNFLGASYSRALEDTVNVNALVPSEEISPSPGSSSGGGVPVFDTEAPQILDVKIIEITLNSAIISWKTNESSSAYIYYGKTLSYETGSLQIHSETLNSVHRTKLENLEANTQYYFQVRALDSAGNQSIKDGFQFRTLAERKIISNVSKFQAVGGDSLINLSWQNPSDADLGGVKIFRSEKFYPLNPEEGALIYNGKGNSFIDINLANGTIYYYTAFVYDSSDNYSSGAVVKAMPLKLGMPTSTPPAPSGVEGTPLASPISQISPVPGITNFKLEDFVFSQNEKNLEIKDKKIEVEFGKSLIISIDSKKVPGLVGTMMFILAQDGEPQSFLFKSDAEKNEYLVSFAPPAIGGVYSLTIAVLDKNNNPAQAISGNLVVSVAEKIAEKAPWYIDLLWIFLIIFIILIARSARIIYKKARKKNKG